MKASVEQMEVNAEELRRLVERAGEAPLEIEATRTRIKPPAGPESLSLALQLVLCWA
jgi:hypothetical protein